MEIGCPQCGAPVPLRTDTRYLACPFCASTFLVRGSTGHAQRTFAHRRDDREAWSLLARFLEDAGVRIPARETAVEYRLFPFWHAPGPGGGQLAPALRADLPELGRISLPGGDLVFLPAGFAAPLPDLPPPEPSASGGTSPSLVYLPLYFLEYRVTDADYSAVVSPLDRRVYAVVRPAGSAPPFPLHHPVMVAGFALALALEALLIGEPVVRGGVFLITLAACYGLFRGYLAREL